MNKPDAFWGWNEPESAANTDYQPVNPYNHATLTDSGHLLELDDTKTRERIRVMHRSNTFIEMHPNGDEVHKIWGDGYYITLGEHNISIGVDDGQLAKILPHSPEQGQLKVKLGNLHVFVMSNGAHAACSRIAIFLQLF